MLCFFSVAEAEVCKMPVTNLARIFGPTIVGYSCPEPDPEMALKQLKKQHLVSYYFYKRFIYLIVKKKLNGV